MICHFRRAKNGMEVHKEIQGQKMINRPQFIYAYGQEYCEISPELIIQEPIDFGKYTINPGCCISYIGDGRAHRSIEMEDGFALEYAGYYDLSNDCRLALFSVFGHYGFKQYNIYYCFRWFDKDYIWILVGPRGGSRNIYPKRIDFIKSPIAPNIGPIQLSFF